MLRSIKQLYGDELRATDGEIGHIKDFYFDDQNWAVRYVVVDTGSWLSGRLVLISPHVFTNFDLDGVRRGVSLTRKQIEKSPDFDSHKPVSRQYEEEYYRYYGCPDYWTQGGLGGLSALPILEPTVDQRPNDPAIQPDISDERGDPHLRSTQALNGYHIQTNEGAIGHVIDFIVDHETWAICHLIVETGRWFSGKEIVILPKQIVRINYEESKVFVSVTKEIILKAPEYHVPPWAFKDTALVAGR
jgi:sporulation protein YlmC with PRC-barrel domain